MFLNRVKNERDTGRFEARGEQMMHMDYLADRRKWEESMARDMNEMNQDVDLEEDDMLPGRFFLNALISKVTVLLMSTDADETDLYALDDYVLQEEAMEMALRETEGHQQSAGPNVSFSDEEYDDIFMTMPDPALSHQNHDMDMS